MTLWLLYAHTLKRCFKTWTRSTVRRAEKKRKQQEGYDLWRANALKTLVPRLFTRLVEIEEADRQQRWEEFDLDVFNWFSI